MPNFQISDLAPAVLPLDLPNTFFEVQTVEGGVQVSRRLAGDDLTVGATITIEDEGVPLVTGADTLNFVGAGVTAVGAGGTKTITIPGLPVPTISSSTLRGAGGTYIEDRTVRINGAGSLSVFDVGETTSVTISNDATNALIFGSALTGVVFSQFANYDFITDSAGANTGWRLDDNGTEIMRILPRDAGAFITTRRIQYHNDDNQWTIVGDITFDQAVGGDRVLMASSMPLIVANVESGFIPFRFGTAGVKPTTGLVDGLYMLQGAGEGGVWGIESSLRHNLSFIAPNTLVYKFDTDTTTTTDPGLGDWKMNNAVPASVTEIAIDDQTQTLDDFGSYWGANLTTGDKIFIKQQNDESKYLVLSVSGALIDGTGFWRIPVTVDDSGTIFDSTEPCSIQFNQAVTTAGGAGGAPTNATYVTISLDATLTDERVLTAGNGITLTDGGAGGNATIDVDQAFNFVFSGSCEFTNVGGLELGPSCELDMRNNADDSTTFFQNLGSAMDIGVAGADFGSQIFRIGQTSFAKVECPVLFIGEQSAGETNVAGDGQVWVRDDAPNTLMFQDDAGNDYTIPAEFDEQATDSTVNNTTTLAATQIQFANIPSGIYRIDMLILARDVAVSGCGLRFQVSATGIGTNSIMRVQNKNFAAAGAPTFDEIGLATDLFDGIALVTGSGTSRFMCTGYVDFISGTNTFEVEFAQDIAQVGDLDFEAGSFCALTKMANT